jgi:hypothetical protein
MREMDGAALDRWITGNYGEDFFRDEDNEDVEFDADEIAALRYDAEEDRIREDRLEIHDWDA